MKDRPLPARQPGLGFFLSIQTPTLSRSLQGQGSDPVIDGAHSHQLMKASG